MRNALVGQPGDLQLPLVTAKRLSDRDAPISVIVRDASDHDDPFSVRLEPNSQIERPAYIEAYCLAGNGRPQIAIPY
jgi:hypothetical protein